MTTMEEKRRLAIKYNNSAPLDLKVWSDYTEVDQVQETLGQTRVRTTQKYTHVLTSQKVKLVDEMSRFLFRVCG